MPWQGNGTFRRTDGVRTGASVWQQAAAAGVDIEPDDHDVHDEDLALGLQNCLTRDGQNSPSANIPMAGFRLTGLGAATTNGHAIVYGQQNVQLGSGVQVGANFKAGAGAQLTDNLTINGQANPVSVEYFRDGTNATLANVVAAGDDDAGNKTEFVEVVYEAGDTTNGSEDGQIRTNLIHNGTKRLSSLLLPNALRVYGYGDGATNVGALELRNVNSSPEDGDLGALVRFLGSNDDGDLEQFASIFAKHATVTDGAEDGELGWNVTRAGSSGVRMRLGGGLVVGSGTPPSTAGVINAEGGYQRDGTAMVVAEVLADETLDDDADFTVAWNNANDYWKIEIIVSGLRPATDDVPILRTSTDGGSTFDSGASDYSWSVRHSGATEDAQDNDDSEIQLTDTITAESDDGNGVTIKLEIIDPSTTAAPTMINWAFTMANNANGIFLGGVGQGVRATAADIDAIQISMLNSSNIAEGRVRVIGYRK